MFSFGARKVLNEFYLNFTPNNLVHRSFRASIISEVGVKVIKSNFGALHCERAKFKGVNLKATKLQNMATSSQGERKGNRLLKEKSPYLLQHAYNPVDWYPWGEEAFEKSKKEKKPIFLSGL